MKLGMPLYVAIKCHTSRPTATEINPSQLREPSRERVRTRFGFIGLYREGQFAKRAPPSGKIKNASQRKSTGRGIKPKPGMLRKKSRKQIAFSGLNLNQTRVSLHPSSIQTITVGLGVSPGHAFWSQPACWRIRRSKLPHSILLVGYTTDRELHPAPKVFIWLLRLYPIGHSRAQFALVMQSTGQTVTHLGES